MNSYETKPKIRPDSKMSNASIVKTSSYHPSSTENTIGAHHWRPTQLTGKSFQLPRSPGSLGSMEEICVLYTIENLSKSPLTMNYNDVLSCDSLAECTNHTIMCQCRLALAQLYYGLRNNDSRVTREGMRVYGQGLTMLNKVLGSNGWSVTSETIIAVLALSIAEVCTILPRSGTSIVETSNVLRRA